MSALMQGHRGCSEVRSQIQRPAVGAQYGVNSMLSEPLSGSVYVYTISIYVCIHKHICADSSYLGPNAYGP